MNYEEWLEANYLTDDASAQLMYEEQAQKIGRPYDEWRERYGYSDTATARTDYAEYQKQLNILTPAKRGPGRPPTGNAMTPAEKQKAYRERKAKNALSAKELKTLASWGAMHEAVKNPAWSDEDKELLKKLENMVTR